jgi:hypothetical protein
MNAITITTGPHAGESGTIIADIAPPQSDKLLHLVQLQDGKTQVFQSEELEETA